MRWGPGNLLLLLLVLALFNAAGDFVLGYLPVSPYAHLLTRAQQQGLGLLQFAAALLALGLAVLALLGLVARQLRRYAAAVLVAIIAAVPMSLVAGAQADRLRRSAFDAFLARSVTVTAAIDRFASVHGRPPAELEELVPEFLPSVPTTGIPGYPAYEFTSGAEAETRYANPWVLQVRVPQGATAWDFFVYFPRQNYATHVDGYPIELASHGWAYALGG